jgi:translation initiation factor 3 subunit B
VSGIRLIWHPDGTFLCCRVERMTKSKKGRFINFELFRVKAKNIPIETLEYKEKDSVSEFKWEPNGYRLGVIHGHVDHPSRPDVSFYDMQGESGELKLMCTLEKKVCNELHWSPKGRFIVLATLGSQAGNLEFYDVNGSAEKKSEPDLIGTDEHFLCSNVAWDPSGRFVSTAVTYWRNRNDNGYVIWSLYGKELHRASVDMLYQFQWRPRPLSLLTPAEEKDARKSLKTLREKYEREDKDLKDSVSSGNAARRKQQRDAYKAFMEEAASRVAAETDLRAALRPNDEEEDVETIVESVETVLSVKSTIDFDTLLLSADDQRD